MANWTNAACEACPCCRAGVGKKIGPKTLDKGRYCWYNFDSGFPFVAFGRANGEWDFPYMDGAMGIRQAVEHLLALGHRRIDLIAWPETSLTGQYRYQGYVAALQAAGISPDPAWIVRTEQTEASA